MAPPLTPTIELNDGTTIPQVGFGVFQIEDEGAESAVTEALDAGYRSIDTAKIYGNERGVGRAIAAADIPREELYITTKVWNADQGFDATLHAFDRSMDRLGLDVLDLYLIHWPVPSKDQYLDTYRALIKLREDGRLRSVGVSNFTKVHLTHIIDETGIVPVLNQIELHPYFSQRQLVADNSALGVVTEAWSPLGQGRGILENAVLVEIASRLGVSPAQVVLRWHLDRGIVVIPKSVTPARIRENLDLMGVKLTIEDTNAIDALDTGKRFGPNPDTFDVT